MSQAKQEKVEESGLGKADATTSDPSQEERQVQEAVEV
jgi:hypothetical protein